MLEYQGRDRRFGGLGEIPKRRRLRRTHEAHSDRVGPDSDHRVDRVVGSTWAFLLVMALVGLGAFYEYDAHRAAHGLSKSGLLGMIGGRCVLGVPGIRIAFVRSRGGRVDGDADGTADFSKSLPSAAAGAIGIVYIFGAWHCAWLLRGSEHHWLMISLAVSWAGDTAAMYVGKAIGKRGSRRESVRERPKRARCGLGDRGGVHCGDLRLFFDAGTSLLGALLVGAIGNIAGQLGDLGGVGVQARRGH